MGSINWNRGLFRAWLALSLLWVVAVFAFERPDRAVVAYLTPDPWANFRLPPCNGAVPECKPWERNWSAVAGTSSFHVTLTDGRHFKVIAPNGANSEDALLYVLDRAPATLPPGFVLEPQARGWSVAGLAKPDIDLIDEARRRGLVPSNELIRVVQAAGGAGIDWYKELTKGPDKINRTDQERVAALKTLAASESLKDFFAFALVPPLTLLALGMIFFWVGRGFRG